MHRRVSVPPLGRSLYRYRNLVEHFFNKPKHFRVIATRYENHATVYPTLVERAAARMWRRACESVA